ncbi:N-acetyltransferase [Taibaiella sp. KBW10]|uniref:GNAT family N-acetyltransferase n=1 Tax=Taibaiella sp. KBW10 TaxID=2153357 RepID=UPI000F5B3715|nr:GNAT family N-acetyltransferase [Taibaiella sp. KBW10]RQO30000.1 N-acetyltransferase [Taibaiella sp. KBW10]
MHDIIIRELTEAEIDLIKQIDRAEEIWEYYEYIDGKLILHALRETVTSFEPDELTHILSRQRTLKEEGGKIIGAFQEHTLVGVASVENKRRGIKLNYGKMDILYVSKGVRGRGVGQRLLEACKAAAQAFGMDKLYISATPTKNTVDFYLGHGAVPATEIDTALFALEPKDIHLSLNL